MPNTAIFSSSSQCNMMQNRHIITDCGGFTHHNPCCVIKKCPSANFGRWMNIHCKYFRDSALYGKGKRNPSLSP
eukprot:Gb_13484 [translate_table: standard]